MNNIQQIETIKQAKLGVARALEELYNNYCNAMFSICIKMIGKKQCAEDVLHDAFVIAFKNLHQLKNEIQFGGWLKTITINECMRYCKKQNNLLAVDIENREFADDNDEQPWWLNIDIKEINKAVNELPNGCREIFYLFALENFGHKEIAVKLGISEGTSKSQYHRAKKLIREKFLNN